MGNLRWILVAILTIRVSHLALLAQPMVQNASFESDAVHPVSWTEWGDAANDPSNVFRVYTAPVWGLPSAWDGERAYGAMSFFPRYFGTITGTITGLTPGQRYYAGVYLLNHHASAGNAWGRVGVDPYAQGNPRSASVQYGDFERSLNAWTPIRFAFQATGNNATILLSIQLSGDGGQATFFDQAFVEPAPDETLTCMTSTGRILALTDFRVDVNEGPEALIQAPAQSLLTGLGFRAWFQDVTTSRGQIRRLNPDGTLGNPMEVRGGYEPEYGLEVNFTLPDCYVLVGFGMRAAYETDLTTMAIWIRPLLPNGTLGPVEEFRSGSEPDSGLEKQFMVEDGRVITGAGVRVSNGDVTGLYVESRRLEIIYTTPEGMLLLY